MGVFTLDRVRVSQQFMSVASAAGVSVLIAIVAVGAAIADPNLPGVGEHWHARYRISVCGSTLPPLPGTHGGVHTHGRDVIHIHPKESGEAGKNATLALLFSKSGGELTDTGLSLPSGETYLNGVECPDGQPGQLQVTVNGKRVGNPSSYVPRNGDRILIEIKAVEG